MGRENQYNAPQRVGYGYIAIPVGVERENFVETCYRRGRVSIITDYGAVINECYITADVLQQILFPKEVGGKGSCVTFISAEFTNKPIIMGILQTNDESTLLREHMYRIRKIAEDGTEIVMQLDPTEKTILINVSSVEPTKINLSVRGNEESEINVASSGKVNITTDKEINLKSYETLNVSIVDVEKEDDIHSIQWTKEGVTVSRKNENGENTVTIDDTVTSVARKTQNADELIQLNDDGILLSINGGEESVEMKKDEVNVKTNKTFKVNGGKEPIPLGTTLAQRLDQVEQQILTIKNAFTSAPVGSMDGGAMFKSGLITATSSITTINFEDTKSKVSFTD